MESNLIYHFNYYYQTNQHFQSQFQHFVSKFYYSQFPLSYDEMKINLYIFIELILYLQLPLYLKTNNNFYQLYSINLLAMECLFVDCLKASIFFSLVTMFLAIFFILVGSNKIALPLISVNFVRFLLLNQFKVEKFFEYTQLL